MTIDEIREKLSREREFGSRFPIRIIFTESLDGYDCLVSQLRGACDIVANVADFCKALDTVPQFDRIKTKLNGEYDEKQVLLLSVGECLRLCIKRELDPERRQFPSFWETQQSEASKTRIIAPVFCCRDLFDRVISAADERQLDYIWTLDDAPTTDSYSLTVYSPKFKEVIVPDAPNLSDWLRNWRSILKKKSACSIITLQESNVEESRGVFNVKTIDSPFGYLKELLLDGDKLDEKWESDVFWNRMAREVSKFRDKITFEGFALQSLNLASFKFVDVVSKWNTLNSFHKELVWLWYRVYPAGDFYSYACQKAKSASDIPGRIRDEILLLTNRSELWIEQRMKAMKALDLDSFDDDYFSLMDKLPHPETKLRLLTYKTHEERTYAVKVVGELLRDGADPVAVADMIAEDYPALATYMRANTGCDEAADEYMTWYRRNKLVNRYPGDYPIAMTFDRFDARYKLLHQMKDKDSAFFWIDGFGVEYAPLFLYELKKRGIEPESVKIAAALLPTETEYNRQWDENDVKWNRLDEISHKGAPDDKSYYSCVVRQLEVFAAAAKEIQTLLETHDYAVVTGDHGSSRLAALAFHEAGVVPITAPKKSTIRSFGRFCELDEKSVEAALLPNMVKATAGNGEKTFLVMNDYRHFAVSGNAAGGNSDENDVVGEIHGGNTPEERLVPVIVVKRKQPLAKLECKPENQRAIKKNGRVETTLVFSRPISNLEVSLAGNKAVCKEIEKGKWRIVLENVTTDTIDLSVVADGKLLPNVTFEVKTQGISKNNDPSDGMGL